MTDKEKGSSKPLATRQSQLRKALRIREQARLALAEQPNSMIRYRLETILAIAEELVAEAGDGPGSSAPVPEYPKEAKR